MADERYRDDEVKIAQRDIRIYLGQCLIDFQKVDKLILSAGDSFVEKMIYITNIVKGVGIEIDKEYKNKITGKIQLKTEVNEMLNERTGRRETKRFHKLGLTKIPSLFMYTDPDKAIEIPMIETTEKNPKNYKKDRNK